jgi:hypothetical protein
MLLKGVQLQLLCGPTVPVPVPRAVIEVLSAVEVKVDAKRTTFQLTFTIQKRSTIPDMFLPTDRPPPQLRVILVVILNGVPDVLVDGVVTHQELNPGDPGKPTTLTVTGEDLSVLMSKEELTGTPYQAMPPEVRVAQILGKYAQHGIQTDIRRPSLNETSSPSSWTPQHHGHDLDYLQLLASHVGHVFYIRTTPSPGTTIAYWGPQIRSGAPQPALSIDLDIQTNTENLSFTFDHTQRQDPVMYVQNADSKQAQKLPPPDPSQVDTPLGRIPTPVFYKPYVSRLANKTPTQASLFGLGLAARSADAATANGKLLVTRYGGLLRARELVGVRGAGEAYDGLWWVDSVTHEIKPNDYSQSFTLKRNALTSTVSKVQL